MQQQWLLGFLIFWFLPPVLKNCDPFAPKPEKQEKREPFDTKFQKCEPFGASARKSEPFAEACCASPPVETLCFKGRWKKNNRRGNVLRHPKRFHTFSITFALKEVRHGIRMKKIIKKNHGPAQPENAKSPNPNDEFQKPEPLNVWARTSVYAVFLNSGMVLELTSLWQRR